MTERFDASRHAEPLIERETGLVGRFRAMGSPCEILIDGHDPVLGRRLFDLAVREVRRIETKYSRYRTDNAVHEINTSAGRKMEVDRETSDLLDFAAQCHDMSDGLFDVTTGVLRKAWRFDGEQRPVSAEDVRKLLPFVGWSNVSWSRPFLTLPAGMEIDLGGICKEFAADRALGVLVAESDLGFLVNLGGDLAARGTRPWHVGIEDVDAPAQIARSMEIHRGALATSGTTKRFVIAGETLYSHILNPTTGWPVSNPPRSVTVSADTCTEAGFLSTLAMLHGPEAEQFLESQRVRFWCYR